jgi:hypothetical protein
MLGLKSFATAAVVIAGIELAERIKKGQFKTDSTYRTASGGRCHRQRGLFVASLDARSSRRQR